MLTKADKKFILDNVATKGDLLNVKEELKSDIADIIKALGAIFEWTDEIHRAIVGKPFKHPSQN